MTRKSIADCRVLVLQNGARHNYAVPLALAKHGMLSGFYTDACGNQGVGRVLSLFSKVPGLHRSLRLLKNRKVPEEVLPLTQSFPFSSWLDRACSENMDLMQSSRVLGFSMDQKGLGEANLIYSSMGWSPWFLKEARKRGVRVVSEFFVRPSLWKVHQHEHRLFPEWESEMPYGHLVGSDRLLRGPCDFSDELIAPTLAVKDDIVKECLFPEERIHVVPYGISDAFFDIQNQPVQGRVLFVGSCTLGKGIHYLAKATGPIIRESGKTHVHFVAAGGVTDVVKNRPECADIEFLGRVPRFEINKLYEKADVLVFPTLSDSFGAVVLEAMAAGIPVVCSPYCSDAVQHGVNGFVVEPRDTESFAKAVSSIIQDRDLRNKMGAAARVRAREYSWERHGETLVQTLQSIRSAASLQPSGDGYIGG